MRPLKAEGTTSRNKELSTTCIRSLKQQITCIVTVFSTETSSRKLDPRSKFEFLRENILIKDDFVKLADFGSCRGVYSQPPFTEYISTRWYRPPECLLTDGYYNHKMDYWGVGCVFFEVLALCPLFPGNNELDQVHKIHNILGTPSDSLLKQF